MCGKDNKCSLIFTDISFLVKDNSSNKYLFQGHLEKGFHSIRFQSSPPTSYLPLIGDKAHVSIWHCRLGHPSFVVMSQVHQQVKLPISSSTKQSSFQACQQGKSHWLPFLYSTRISTQPIQLIHSDLWGPGTFTSKSSYRYYVSFIYDYSWFT